jgi:Saxitoxin biosynthesis operon protein SxtJ
MATGIPAGLTSFTARDGRRFGVQVGLAVLALAGVARWRGHPTTAAVLGTVGALLLVGGVLAPARLGPVYRAWMGLAAALSKVTTPLFMGLVYFVVLTPLGLVLRAVGHRPLADGRGAASTWVPRRAPARPEGMEHQF